MGGGTRCGALVQIAQGAAGGTQLGGQVGVVAGDAGALGDRLPAAVDVSQEQLFVLVLRLARRVGSIRSVRCRPRRRLRRDRRDQGGWVVRGRPAGGARLAWCGFVFVCFSLLPRQPQPSRATSGTFARGNSRGAPPLRRFRVPCPVTSSWPGPRSTPRE